MIDEKNAAAIRLYISKMPSLPTTVVKVMEICNNPQASPADLNQVISLDPVLMGKVMKLINSAYYGLPQQITSLVRAIIMLGINTVKNLALSTAVLGTLGKAANFTAINMEGFWRHSLCTGVTAKLLAKKRGVPAKILEEYFISGVLHDLGKVPLNHKLSEAYISCMSLADRERSPLFAAETKSIGINHTDVGLMIAELWKLGSAISDTITYHHRPLEYKGENRDMVFTVAMANYFSNLNEIGYSGDRYPEKLPKEVGDYLKLGIDYLDEIEDEVNREIEKASIFLKLA
jgi:HD-like signal output (HDOD) protein